MFRLVLALLIVAPLAALGEEPDPQWLRLGHYAENFFGGYSSQAQGDKFFLSPEGADDPDKELAATIEAFQSGRLVDGEPAACRFPARFIYLKRKLALRDVFCRRFIEFRDQIAAKSVSLVFSSYYLNNPASAFGHSMMRLNRTDGKDGKPRYELLDNGVNYAAEVTVNNPVLYAVYGLFGLFHGSFTRLPYFYKVREYNDYESRDLWEYDLNLTPAQLEMLVAHTWELGSTYFKYYYLTQNCAYHMLTALEAAVPDVELVKGLPMVVIPADTVRAVNNVPGFVTDVHYRPSMRVQFGKRLDELSPKQREALHGIEDDREARVADNFTPAEKAQVLDAALDYVDMKHFRKLVDEPDGPEARWKHKILLARAELPVTSEPLSIETPAADIPHIGHGIMRAGVESGAGPGGDAYGIASLRFALHDLLDPRAGYPGYAQIEFLDTRVRYTPRAESLRLDEFTLFRVVSLTPTSDFNRQLSWKFRLGASTIRDESCDHCVAGDIEFGTGITKDVGRYAAAFLMLDGELALSPKFYEKFFRVGAGPSLGVKLTLTPTLITLVSANYRFQWLTPAHRNAFGAAEARWSFMRNAALDIRAARYPDGWEGGAGLFYYF